ncbi:hypothetical protein [Nostoc flagelliforme]|uniref:hypothetical protein n=1 Tax=Nostoc flagelliforme TaxID=1306274 RepID=UPI001F54E85E|nr:hypothetical protein [Nostoc flagelliforme]
MISENDDSIDAVNELVRKISIKETQLKIAQESNLIQTAEALENQLSQLFKNWEIVQTHNCNH